jgi:hypothetical protein
MQSNEAFIDKYDTSLNPNTAGGDFEGFIATSFGGEKGRNTGIGFWEDPETKTTWTHRDVDVIFGKEIIPPYQVEVSNNTGTEPTGEKLFYHYSAFVEVKAGKNFLKRNVDETRVLKFVLAFTRGRLVANHYLSKYSNNVDLIFVTKYPVNIRDLVTVFENLLKSTGTIWLEIYK